MQKKNNTQPQSNKTEEKKIKYFVPTEPKNQNKVPFFLFMQHYKFIKKYIYARIEASSVLPNTIINPDQTPLSLMTIATLQMVTEKRPQKSKWKG